MSDYIIKTDDSLIVVTKQKQMPVIHSVSVDTEDSTYIRKLINTMQLQPVPRQIMAIEANAEAIVDNIYIEEWGDAINNINTIRVNMNELMPVLQENSVPNELISNMNAAITRLNQDVMQQNTQQAITQANQIMMYVADMLDYFDVMVPTDLNRLNFFARQIIIEAENNNWDQVNANYLEANQVWERLKPELGEQYSNDVNEFDLALSNLAEPIDSRNYQMTVDNANILLDRLDFLSNDFAEQNFPPETPPQNTSPQA